MIESIISFFEHIPAWQRTLILAGGLLFFWVLEGVVPILKMQYHRTRHLGVNLFFTLTTLLVNLAFAVLIVEASDWSVSAGFGVLQVLGGGIALALALLHLDVHDHHALHDGHAQVQTLGASWFLAIAAASFIYIAAADLIPGLHEQATAGAALRLLSLLLAGIGTIAWMH